MNFKWTFLFITAFNFCIAGEEPSQITLKESFAETKHSAVIHGKELPYIATAGNLILQDSQSKDSASIFFVAYNKENVNPNENRPITFCFNGGPGSAAIWLNIGVFGPRIVDWSENSKTAPPYGLIDNPDSLLDLTDLVFIDPVSTGHSVTAPGQDPKQFHGVVEDVKSVANFIRLYLSKYKRWDSPKYIAGESYGTTRAAGLSYLLQDDYGIYLNGVILVSSILSFQTRNPSSTNELPYMMFLPTYAATALYHNKLDSGLPKDLPTLLKQAEEFALGEYALALLKGDKLEDAEKSKIATKLAAFTGLSKDYVERANLRIESWRYRKELLRNEQMTIGVFDGRLKGVDIDSCGESSRYDPSLSFVYGSFTGAFNNYLQTELNWENTAPYYILADVQPWDYGKGNQCVDKVDDLQKSLMENPSLKIFVASGYYDSATPYFATAFTFNHFGFGPSYAKKFFLHDYEGGHMMYLSKPIRTQLLKDLENFYKS